MKLAMIKLVWTGILVSHLHLFLTKRYSTHQVSSSEDEEDEPKQKERLKTPNCVKDTDITPVTKPDNKPDTVSNVINSDKTSGTPDESIKSNNKKDELDGKKVESSDEIPVKEIGKSKKVISYSVSSDESGDDLPIACLAEDRLPSDEEDPHEISSDEEPIPISDTSADLNSTDVVQLSDSSVVNDSVQKDGCIILSGEEKDKDIKTDKLSQPPVDSLSSLQGNLSPNHKSVEDEQSDTKKRKRDLIDDVEADVSSTSKDGSGKKSKKVKKRKVKDGEEISGEKPKKKKKKTKKKGDVLTTGDEGAGEDGTGEKKPKKKRAKKKKDGAETSGTEEGTPKKKKRRKKKRSGSGVESEEDAEKIKKKGYERKNIR